MHPGHSLFIIYADTEGELPAETLGRALGDTAPFIAPSFTPAIEALVARRTPPSYLAIDIGARGRDVLPELDRLAEVCDASARVIVTGRINDVAFYRTLIERGIVEYYAYPLDIQAIATGLLGERRRPHSGQERRGAPSVKEGAAIGFVSAASGDGASTVALNTAYILANQFDSPTVLVDLDYQFGMIARHLDLQAQYGIRELLEYPERGVDSALVQRMLIPYGKNLHIIAAPTELRRLPSVQPELILDLLKVLKSQFTYVIFDIPNLWVDWIAILQTKLDHNVLVAQLWLRSLTHVTRMLAAWKEVGISRERVSLVINRSGAKFKEAMTAHDFERVANTHIQFLLANDTKTIVVSENQGKTLMEMGNSPLEKQIVAIAQYLHTLCSGEEPIVEKEPKKKGLKSLLNKR